VRFPPTATKEIQYLNAKGALTYTDIAGDPVLYGKSVDRKSGSAGMPRPISYAVFCLKKKNGTGVESSGTGQKRVEAERCSTLTSAFFFCNGFGLLYD